MKTISVRKFQLNAAKYLKELPLTLTVYKKPVAILLPHIETVAKYGDKPVLESSVKNSTIDSTIHSTMDSSIDSTIHSSIVKKSTAIVTHSSLTRSNWLIKKNARPIVSGGEQPSTQSCLADSTIMVLCIVLYIVPKRNIYMLLNLYEILNTLFSYNMKIDNIDVGTFEFPESVDISKVKFVYGFCQEHFEQGVKNHCVVVSYEDWNGTKVWTKRLCPNCYKEIKNKVSVYGGKLVYL